MYEFSLDCSVFIKYALIFSCFLLLDSVFCCSCDKTGRFFVSGGQDETAFVWSLDEMKNKFECAGNLK